jgi:hypothetical protein
MINKIKYIFFVVLEKFTTKYCEMCDEILLDDFCDYCTEIR